MFNLMTCEGWADGFTLLGSCTLGWFGAAILVFLGLIARRQIEDNLGMSFNVIIALILGLALYVIVITFTGAIQWAFLAGVVGEAAGGFGGGLILNSGGGGGEQTYV